MKSANTIKNPLKDLKDFYVPGLTVHPSNPEHV